MDYHHHQQQEYIQHNQGYAQGEVIHNFKGKRKIENYAPQGNGHTQGSAQGQQGNAQGNGQLQGTYLNNPPQSSDCSCIDVANHIQACPLCSKFYKCDKTLYIIVIIVLILVALILLKKILGA